MSTEKKPTISRFGHQVTSFDGFKLPVGTTAQRSETPEKGFFRFNDETKRLEYFNASYESVRTDLTFESVKSADFTAAVNRAYPVNTSTRTMTVTAPASPRQGDRFSLIDHSGTWNTRKVTLATSDGSKVERRVTLSLDVVNDHVVFIYTGIPGLGWVRENGGYPLVPVYNAIDLKADKTYVDNLPNTTTHDDLDFLPNTETSVIEFPTETVGFRVLLHVSKIDGNSEMFEVMATRNSAGVPIFTICSEIRTGPSDLVFNVDRGAGMRLNVTSALAGKLKMKVIWNAIGESYGQ